MRYKLKLETLIVLWLWHTTDDVVDDESAYVALTRLKAFVDEALGILEGDTPCE